MQPLPLNGRAGTGAVQDAMLLMSRPSAMETQIAPSSYHRPAPGILLRPEEFPPLRKPPGVSGLLHI